MEPIYWVMIFLALAVIVSLVARKKGRSGLMFFLAVALPPIPLMLITSYLLGDSMDKKPFAMWFVAFICPVIGFLAAVMANNNEEMAVKTGAFGEYKKCPFCAESVRREAVKCKHCQSSLTTS
jgi:hypothetical protein